MLKPKASRAQWTFTELRAKWGWSELDMRREIMAGTLRPAIHFHREMHPALVIEGEPIYERANLVQVSQWLWLVPECGRQIDNFECVYVMFRDGDRAEANYLALPEPLTLTQLLVIGVVFDSNVRELEQPLAANTDLSKREERTRDLIIVNLAFHALGWDPASDRSKGVTQLVQMGQANGLPVNYDTAKRHLRIAWERCQPKLDATGDECRPYESKQTA